MGNYYQGQKYQTAEGNILVYDTKRGWQAVDQQTAQSYKTSLKDVQTQKDSYNRIKGQAPLLQQADKMIDAPRGLLADVARAVVPNTGSRRDGKVNAGGLLNNLPWMGGLGAALSPDADSFKNLGERIQNAGGNPMQGQGAVSDYERKLASAGSPSLQNFNTTNRDIIAQRQALINEQRDYANFLSDYVKRKGNSQGADEVWQRYIAEDPYYSPSSSDPSRNTAKSKDPDRWRRFIYGGSKVAPQAPRTTKSGASVSKW